MAAIISPFFMLFVSFVGIYMNVWFLLLTFEHKSKLYKKKKATRFPTVSILIPAHNEAKTIGRCLKSVLSLNYPHEKLEAIVIDNGSTDGTSKIVKGIIKKIEKIANNPRIKLITLPKPGKVDAMNIGLKSAGGEIVGILDADTFVTKNSLGRMVGFFEDREVGAVTNYVNIANPGGLLGFLQRIEYIFSAFTKKLFSFLNAVYATPGTMSLLRKGVIENVGFSDDTLGEDMDIALYILKRDYKIVNCLDALAYTLVPRTLAGLLKQRVRWYRGFIENVKKHSDMLFNTKYYHLGWFILPFASFMAVFVGVVLTIFLAMNYFQQSLLMVKDLAYMPVIDWAVLTIGDLMKPMNFFMEPYSLIAYVIILSGSLITLFITFHFLKIKKDKKMLLLPFYFFVYYSMLMVFWLVSMLLELFGAKKKW